MYVNKQFNNCFYLFSFLFFNTYVSISLNISPKTDVTLVGFINQSDGIGNNCLGFINCLRPTCSIQFVKSRACEFADVLPNIINLVQKAPELSRYSTNQFNNTSNITIFADLLWTYSYWDSFIKFVGHDKKHTINIAYSMNESTLLHPKWVERLNFFDMVVVPDEFLINVYKNSGVRVPIFVLPIPLDLKNLLHKNTQKQTTNKFVFGCSALFSEKKNQKLLRDAFVQEFSDNPNVFLRLHSKHSAEFSQDFIDTAMRAPRVEIVCQNYNKHEHEEFLASLDAYVLISKAEGYSIIPRQAMALGIPCILSNAQAQKTLCDSGFVCAVPANISEPVYWEGRYIGDKFNCTVNDVRVALRDMYEHYTYWREQAFNGREWVKRFNYDGIRAYVCTLVKPKKIVLSQQNKLESGVLKTNSKKLYEKYKFLSAKKVNRK